MVQFHWHTVFAFEFSFARFHKFTGQLLLIEISTIQPFTVILMHTGASPFFNNLAFLIKNKTENDFRAIFTSFLKLQNYVFSSKVSLCKILWISEKDANSWDFLELNFSPTIYPPIICLKRLFSATYQKKEIPDNVWLSGICLIFLLFSVIRLGYEPNVISSSISALS